MFWQADDVENKHFFVGLSYVGNDDTQSSDVSVSTDVFMKLISPVFQLVCNVASDNFSPDLAWYDGSLKRRAVAWEKCHKTGSSRKSKKKKELHKKEVFRFDRETPIMLASCQCKSNANVAILSCLHPDV